MRVKEINIEVADRCIERYLCIDTTGENPENTRYNSFLARPTVNANRAPPCAHDFPEASFETSVMDTPCLLASPCFHLYLTAQLATHVLACPVHLLPGRSRLLHRVAPAVFHLMVHGVHSPVTGKRYSSSTGRENK